MVLTAAVPLSDLISLEEGNQRPKWVNHRTQAGIVAMGACACLRARVLVRENVNYRVVRRRIIGDAGRPSGTDTTFLVPAEHKTG